MASSYGSGGGGVATATSTSYSSPSPLRSSPLSKPPVFSPSREPSPSPAQPIPAPNTRRAHQTPDSGYTTRGSSSRLSLSPLVSPPLSPSPTSPSPPLSRSQPLLGSYSLSLMNSRMSHAHQPHSSHGAFSLQITAMGKGKGKACPAHLRCPKPLNIPFTATYYDLENTLGGGSRNGGASQSPWVGTVNLEQYYIGKFSNHTPSSVLGDLGVPRAATASGGEEVEIPPDYPGMQVAPVGQLQLLVRTTSSAIKVFCVPYDLRGIPPGGRLLVRDRTFVQGSEDSTGLRARNGGSPSPSPGVLSSSPSTARGESLRYAVQLQFMCLPGTEEEVEDMVMETPHIPDFPGSPSSPSSPDFAQGNHSPALNHTTLPSYYISRHIKIIFTSSPPDPSEVLRSERTNDLIPPPQEGSGTIIGLFPSPSPSSGGRRVSSSGQWEGVRQKWFARYERDRDRNTATASSPSVLPPLLHIAAIPAAAAAAAARPKTPTPEPFPTPAAAPASPRYSARRKLRRGSQEERELSEKLLALDVGERPEALRARAGGAT